MLSRDFNLAERIKKMYQAYKTVKNTDRKILTIL